MCCVCKIIFSVLFVATASIVVALSVFLTLYAYRVKVLKFSNISDIDIHIRNMHRSIYKMYARIIDEIPLFTEFPKNNEMRRSNFNDRWNN